MFNLFGRRKSKPGIRPPRAPGDTIRQADCADLQNWVRGRAFVEAFAQLINALAASAPRPKTALAGEAQTATATTPMDANIPESQQKETPRVAVSFATISRPHTKDALETKDDVDDFLDAYRRELIAAIENGKKILL